MEELDNQQKEEKAKSFWSKMNTASETSFMQIFTRLPFFVFLIFLGVVHIANTHLAEFYVRDIVTKEKLVKRLRWQYLATSADMMKQTKQSSVAEIVEEQGLRPLRVPPNIVEE